MEGGSSCRKRGRRQLKAWCPNHSSLSPSTPPPCCSSSLVPDESSSTSLPPSLYLSFHSSCHFLLLPLSPRSLLSSASPASRLVLNMFGLMEPQQTQLSLGEGPLQQKELRITKHNVLLGGGGALQPWPLFRNKPEPMTLI